MYNLILDKFNNKASQYAAFVTFLPIGNTDFTATDIVGQPVLVFIYKEAAGKSCALGQSKINPGNSAAVNNNGKRQLFGGYLC
jgi:hypothetical protein